MLVIRIVGALALVPLAMWTVKVMIEDKEVRTGAFVAIAATAFFFFVITSPAFGRLVGDGG